jgi:hypothetical protein
VPDALQRRGHGTWREAFLKFPRELDGTVTTDNFAKTLQKLVSAYYFYMRITLLKFV